MTPQTTNWLTEIQHANQEFRNRVSQDSLPTQRGPGKRAIITCMDPRVNLEALGVTPFAPDGSNDSAVRIIRTVGGIAELRSLVIGTYLAGFAEIALVMHTDCGGCLAYHNIDRLIDTLRQRLPAEQLTRFEGQIGAPFRENLMGWLKVFEEPRAALQREVAVLRAADCLPPDLIIHGLLYTLENGRVEVVVDGVSGH